VAGEKESMSRGLKRVLKKAVFLGMADRCE
jgi:hypothetical protein